jgi:Rrf2 family protein
MAALAFNHDREVPSSTLAGSVHADPSFVRKSLSKLAKAGLVVARRGKGGATRLARSPRQITLLDVYRASGAPPAVAIHNYPVEKRCLVSCNIKQSMSAILARAQSDFEKSLAKITLADMLGKMSNKSR